MSRKSVSILLLCTLIVTASCARLDSNLYNPSKVDSYLLDDYQGETDIAVDDPKYDILATFIHHLDGEIISNDGKSEVPLQAYFIGDRTLIGTPGYKVILYCHGNRDHMDFYWPRIKLLANIGAMNEYGVLAIDYRGYGATPGEPSESGMYADVDAAIKWLQNENGGLAANDFILYGFSLGTAAATELSANPRSALVPSKLILEAPFASAEVMVQDNTLLALPGSFVTNVKIDNAEEIKKLGNVPLLWLHGKQDDFLDIKRHGEVVYKNHPGTENVDKFAVRVDDAHHSNIPEKLGSLAFEDYLNQLRIFLQN